ncbi:MAG: hypothetical protein RIT45_2188 [Pseudomonadota bacterium]|jgi:hypothetical protein
MSPLPFAVRNPALLDRLQPYVVATPDNLPALDLAPFGLPTPAENLIDPLRAESGAFLDVLHRLDGLTFGPEGMPMPKWVFYDCSELPGAIYGFACPASELWPEARALFALPAGYHGLVPLSMYIAIPMAHRGVWFGHNLASAAPRLREAGVPDDLTGLGSLTKGLALRAFGVRHFWGATQWDSKALFIHAKFGALRLATAWTPAHSEPATLTYGFDVDDACLRASMGDPSVALTVPTPDLWIRSGDLDAMIALQDRIEAGERFVVAGPPQRDAEGQRVPIAQVAADGVGLGPGLGSPIARESGPVLGG